jgi:hypothetical protein
MENFGKLGKLRIGNNSMNIHILNAILKYGCWNCYNNSIPKQIPHQNVNKISCVYFTTGIKLLHNVFV